MARENQPDPLARFALTTVVVLAVAKLALHVGTNAFGPYGFHRDEFLYFAMGDHLRLFGMDFPPFIALVSNATRWLFGDSLVAIRLTPALAGAAILVTSAMAAREFGGGRYAQGLAAFSVLASALFLRAAQLFQPVVFDQLWWTLALFCIAKLGSTENPRWWIGYGIAAGLGLMTKFSILIFGFATLIALIVTRDRKWLTTRWPWYAAGIALALGSPSIVGQIVLDFPVLGQMEELGQTQFQEVSVSSFLLDQPKMFGGFVVAIIGMLAMIFHRTWRRYQAVGVTTAIAFLTLLVLHGKSYYIGPIYPVLFAAGAVVFERVKSAVWGPIARWGIVLTMLIYLVVLLPLGVPVLEPASMEKYLVAIGLQSAATTNVGDQERIPQDYADMLNWEEQVAAVAQVYHALEPVEREKAVILASNYGEAGAIDFFGPRYGLPRVVSFVGSYWYFGPGDLPGEVVILHGFEENVGERFESVVDVGTVTHPYAVAEERDLVIRIGRGPRNTLQELWPTLEGIH